MSFDLESIQRKHRMSLKQIINQFNGESKDEVSMEDCTLTPFDYLTSVLDRYEYPYQCIDSLSSGLFPVPTPEQIKDYQFDILNAVRNSNCTKLQNFHKQGRCINACNKFGESVIHMASRQSDLNVIMCFIEILGPECIFIVDDTGRTPLHDACWASPPSFPFVEYLLDLRIEMLFMKDKRGHTPLSYIKPENRQMWIHFINSVQWKYWPKK